MTYSEPYTNDRQVVSAILLRNQKVTQQYLYIKCYPLFKAVYDNYYTDCQSCVEFINELYVHLLTPNRNTGLCKLQTFQFGSTLTTWLKTVAVYYCYEHYRRKKRVAMEEQVVEFSDGESDRFSHLAASMYVEEQSWQRHDLQVLLGLMPNKRYAQILHLLYLEGLSMEDAARQMGMTIDNFYNKHRRARIQFNEILKKEKKI